MRALTSIAIAILLYSACSSPGGSPNVAGKLIESAYYSGYGTSAASGTIAFYNVGTLTPAVVYGDDSLSTPLSQPITLDARGATPTAVYTATPLRAIVKSSSGATLADIARIDGDRAELVAVANSNWTGADLNTVLSALAASTGGTDGQFKDVQAGAVVRPIFTKFSEVQRSVKDFGAVGNGIADDTGAIQAGINAVIAAGGGVLFFPAGTYNTSSALSAANAPATYGGMIFRGVGISASKIQNTNATGNLFNIANSATGNYIVDSMLLTHSTSSSGTAISATSTNVLLTLTNTSINKHASGVTGPINPTVLYSQISATSGSALSGNSAIIIDSTLIATTGKGAVVSGPTYCFGSSFSGSFGIDLSGGTLAPLYAFGCDASAATTGLRIATSGGGNEGIAYYSQNNWGTVTDNRAGPPLLYSISTTSAFTPLPSQADSIKAVGTAGGITITVNAIATTGFGKKFSLICSNTSGGAVTWTFNAQYVLSAAVAPATGNRVNLLLEYNPIDNKVYEIGRAATAN